MSNDLHQMTQDLQTRIRELAYLMWESAGRQQGMAIEYWLKAESEVMSTLQAAARMLPGGTTVKTEAKPVPSAGTSERAVKAAPVAAAGESAPAAIAQPTMKAGPGDSPSPAEKPGGRKVVTRGKAKT